MNARAWTLLAALLSLPLAGRAAPTATVTVSATESLGPVPPFVFGHNLEAGDSYRIFGPTHNYGPPRTGTGLWDPDKRALVPAAAAFTRDIGAKMLRYPGGCLAHGFDWKATVGPPADRPNFTFGVDEFLASCRALGAEPLMTVSDYTGGPQDAADLVEYVNAPASPAHPWAQKRAAWGRPKPYGVRFFEMGNESDHGNHDLLPPQKFTAAAYAAWFNDCARRMRAIDPTIKMGALMGTGTGPDDPWNPTVLAGVKSSADFIIVHTYVVNVWGENGTGPTTDVLMRACMATGDQTAAMLAQYRAQIAKYAGKSLPLAITEYNGGFVQEKPLPYRFAFGPALFSADYVRILMQPESHVLMANYWQYLNGYWGAVLGPNQPGDPQPWRKMPAFYLFRLWGRHFGSKLVRATVQSPRIAFEGIPGHTAPARGDTYQPDTVLSAENLLAGQTLQAVSGNGYKTETLPDGALRATLTSLSGEHYLPIGKVKGPPGCVYRITFQAHATGDLSAASLGLGMGDSRGWDQTHSGIAVEGAQGANNWQPFVGRFVTLPDSAGTDVIWRLRPGTVPASGTVEIRNLKVNVLTPEHFPAYAAVTSTASLSSDGKTLYVIVFNKHHADAIATSLNVQGFPAHSARRWTVTGPDLAALNTTTETVRETESGVPLAAPVKGLWRQTLPPRSMTGFEFRR